MFSHRVARGSYKAIVFTQFKVNNNKYNNNIFYNLQIWETQLAPQMEGFPYPQTTDVRAIDQIKLSF